MRDCCEVRKMTKRRTWVRRCRKVAAWVLPGALLALMPKCPACVAAYVALWTGLGLSLSAAFYLRSSLLVLCVASLLYLVLQRLGRFLGFANVPESVREHDS